jgi:hypothetical protein
VEFSLSGDVAFDPAISFLNDPFYWVRTGQAVIFLRERCQAEDVPAQLLRAASDASYRAKKMTRRAFSVYRQTFPLSAEH